MTDHYYLAFAAFFLTAPEVADLAASVMHAEIKAASETTYTPNIPPSVGSGKIER